MASVVDSEVDAEASVAEVTVAASEAASTVLLAAVASAVVVAIVALAARPTLRVVPALHPAHMAAVDPTVTATTTEEEVVGLDATTDPVVGTAAAAAEASTDHPAATMNPSALGTATVVAAVGIAIEARTTAEGATTTAETTAEEETTRASVHTKAARVMRESAKCVDTNCDKTFWSCGGYPESTCLAFPVLISFTFDTKGKQTEATAFPIHLGLLSTKVHIPLLGRTGSSR